MNQATLESCVRKAGIDVQPVWHEETGSTNDDAQRLAASGAPEWTIVAAGHQTEGKGRLGREWTDAPGTSLLTSVILRPALPPDRAGLISLQAAASVVEIAGPASLRSKWPNDIVAGERKVGGVLAEARVRDGRIEYLALGVGVNVATAARDFPQEFRSTSTSLLAQGWDGDMEGLMTGFLASFREAYTGPSFPAGLVERYAAVCSTIGRTVRAVSSAGEDIVGVATTLDERGGLIVETANGASAIGFGEVRHLR